MPESATLMDSYTEMTELLLPNDTNDLGRALGGVVMHWMDLCGVVAAMRFSGRQCVTAAIDHVDFAAPIDLGQLAVMEGFVFDAGDTSLDVAVEVRAEDPRTGETRTATNSFVTYVALDADGRPTEVPALETPTDNQAKLREEALQRRREQLREAVEKLEG